MKNRLTGVRVAVDARYLARPGMGISEYLVGVLRLLRLQGAELTLVTDVPLQLPVDLADLPITKITGRPRVAIAWEQLRMAVFLYRNTFDYYFAPANVGLPLLYFGRTKLILTVHDLIPLHYLGELVRKQPLRMLFYLPSTLIAMVRANRIMAVSEATAKDIQRIFHRKATATLIPLSHLRFAADQQLKPARVRKSHIIYNGGLDARKNVSALVSAFAVFRQTYPEYKLVVLGKGTDVLMPQITALGLKDAVVLTGYVSQRQKFDMLCEASIVAYPSSLEGYGLPIVEALQTRTPIVCGVGGSQKQTAGKAGIFASPVTPDSIALALKEAAALHQDKVALRAYRRRQAEQLAYLSSKAVDENIVSIFC